MSDKFCILTTDIHIQICVGLISVQNHKMGFSKFRKMFFRLNQSFSYLIALLNVIFDDIDQTQNERECIISAKRGFTNKINKTGPKIDQSFISTNCFLSIKNDNNPRSFTRPESILSR